MKKEFIGFYNPTEEEINESWTNGIFAFDANTLLNLYRYSETTRKDFLDALKGIKDRLFLPYQSAFEFHNNRNGVVDTIANSYAEIENFIKEIFKSNVEPQLNRYKKHPTIKIENIIGLYNGFLEKVKTELVKQQENHPDFKLKDEVLDELTELFENVVGKKPTKEELITLYAEGKTRYNDKVPPGFKDEDAKKGKGDRNIYGDFIIWKELIDYTKNSKNRLIFITDDSKEDWWKKEQGKTIRPREELIKEFFDITGIRILIYNPEQFLQFVKSYKLIPKIDDKSIKEIKDLRISDEINKSDTKSWPPVSGSITPDWVNNLGHTNNSVMPNNWAASFGSVNPPSLTPEWVNNLGLTNNSVIPNDWATTFGSVNPPSLTPEWVNNLGLTNNSVVPNNWATTFGSVNPPSLTPEWVNNLGLTNNSVIPTNWAKSFSSINPTMNTENEDEQNRT